MARVSPSPPSSCASSGRTGSGGEAVGSAFWHRDAVASAKRFVRRPSVELDQSGIGQTPRPRALGCSSRRHAMTYVPGQRAPIYFRCDLSAANVRTIMTETQTQGRAFEPVSCEQRSEKGGEPRGDRRYPRVTR